VIKLSKWTVLAGALAAVIAFLDSIVKFLRLADQLPLPDWTLVLVQYKVEVAAVVVLSAIALAVDWAIFRNRYAAYRSLWMGPVIRLRSRTIFPEEVLVLLALLGFVSMFLYFESRKARTLYTSYGFDYLVNARCDGDFVAARDRADALAKNSLWNKYSDILPNLKERYDTLAAIRPRRVATFGKYRDELPPELLQSDIYEMRILFRTDLDVGARAREAKQPRAREWLESPAPCNGR
jgi:hypothetical protein